MTIITRIKWEVPKNLPVKQVYGICFTKNWQILLRIENWEYKLTWWKPDFNDKNFSETLKREFIEEINTKINKPYIVWYQLIDEENWTQKYAQIRMTALIENIWEAKPDTDKNHKRIYGRYLTSLENAAKLLNRWEIGYYQIQDAYKIAKQRFWIQVKNIPDKLINEESCN